MCLRIPRYASASCPRLGFSMPCDAERAAWCRACHKKSLHYTEGRDTRTARTRHSLTPYAPTRRSTRTRTRVTRSYACLALDAQHQQCARSRRGSVSVPPRLGHAATWALCSSRDRMCSVSSFARIDCTGTAKLALQAADGMNLECSARSSSWALRPLSARSARTPPVARWVGFVHSFFRGSHVRRPEETSDHVSRPE